MWIRDVTFYRLTAFYTALPFLGPKSEKSGKCIFPIFFDGDRFFRFKRNTRNLNIHSSSWKWERYFIINIRKKKKTYTNYGDVISSKRTPPFESTLKNMMSMI